MFSPKRAGIPLFCLPSLLYNNKVMRVDKYLKISRLIKRRSVAHDACEDARIFVNGKEAKPGKDIKPGDEIKIVFGQSEMKVKVLSTPEHVGKDDAASLYEVIN